VSARAWRPLGFLLVMLGFGFRLDSDWQALAWMLFLAGGAAALLGLRAAGQTADPAGAFVRPPGGR
jgi:hypothetical protein